MYKKWIVSMGLIPLLAFGHMASAEVVGYWPFDEGSGTTVTDATGLNGEGTFTGDVSWVPGVSRSALHFDGNGDYVTLQNNARTQLRSGGGFTVAAWVKVEKVDNGVIMMVGQGCSTWASWYLGVGGGEPDAPRNEGNLLFATRTSGGSAYSATATPLVPDTWVHIAATHDGTTLVLYQDGVEVNRVAAGTPYQNADPFYIGGDPGCNGRQWFGGSLDELQIYDAAVPENEIRKIMRGNAGISSNPYPPDGAVDVPRDIILSWTAGDFAATHDVYFGTAFDDVNDASRSNPMGVLLSRGQTVTTLDPPGVLDFGTTYYWRVDEVNAPPDSTIFKGEVWSFIAEPFAYPIANITATSNGTSDPVSTAQRTVDGSGIDAAGQASTNSFDMWLATPGEDPLYIQFEFDRVYKLHQMLVWNYNVQFELLLGFGLKNVTVEYSENGTDWTALGDFELARATAKATYTANTTVDFGGVPAKYVRLNVNSGYGMMGQYGLSEVRFMYIPAHAREPKPADGATGVDVNTSLRWRSGREAASHEIYLGTDPDALPLVGTVSTAAFTAGNLEFGSTYYWQIVEVNAAEAVTAWAGDLWDFSTQEYMLIDGFETYDDDVEAGTAIFDTWLDGWVNDTGSTVGYFNAPFAEKTIVRSGKQSMPLAYDNTKSPFYSEAEREFATGQNWSGYGADTLVLYVRGRAPAFLETADGSILMNGIGTDIWNNGDQFRYAYRSLGGNGSITIRVDSLAISHEWAKAGVMIRETLEAGSKHAFVALTPTPSHGISFQRRPTTDGASANTDVADIALPHWVKLTRTSNVFTAQQSQDGETWIDIVVSPALDIAMAANVYIGLAVCSHDTAIVTGAEFSNVSTTGNVTGAWQVAEIGVAQPAGNSAEAMYVTIEDGAGKTKTVVNPDAAITARPVWQEWRIPYSDLSGVNLGRVDKMVIGVGNRTSPTAGGTGTVYVDDIGYGRPTPTE